MIKHTNIMKKFLIACILLLGISINISAQDNNATIEVAGIVLDEKNDPMISVSVAVVDVPGLGTFTDVDGKFKIKMKPYQRLIFSYIGYNKVEVLIKEQREVKIVMKESSSSVLDEVVVTGTGVQKKVTVTGAISSVDVEDLKANPTGSISNFLAGNVAGVLAMQSSGKPGSTSEFWIRGISTFGASNAALVLVDGFERNIDEINVEDVETFDVLKDASATAIYGSRGANGVILITTKRGQAGKIKIKAKGEATYSSLTKVPEFVDGVQWAQMANEARITRNQDPIFQPDEINIMRLGLDPDLYPNVNWKDVLLKDGASSYRATIEMSGGGSTARYFVSGAYQDQEGMYKTDKSLKDYNTNANFKRYNYRMNFDIDITSSTLLKVGVSGSLEKFNDPGLGSDFLWNSIMGYNPTLTPVMYSNGYVPAFGEGDRTNPWVLSTMTGYTENWNNNIQTNITLEQNFDFITKGLRFNARFGYDTENKNWIARKKWPEQWKAERYRNNGELVFSRVSEEGKLYQESGSEGKRNEFFEAEFHYDRGIGRHHFGGTVKYNQASKIKTVDIGTDIKNGIAERNQGLAGRVTYRLDYRYFLEFNFGYTGSENFAVGHQFGFFPAISGAWNIADESFVKDRIKWMDLFKIRYSYGRVGSDDLRDTNDNKIRFPYLYTIANDGSYQFADYGFGNSYSGKRFTQVASPYVTWEIATKHDVGLDVSVFGDKFSFTVDYFNEKREGIFLERKYLPSVVGLESNPWANVGKTKVEGFDGNFKFNQKINQVNLTLRGNMTYSKNEIVDKDEENRYYSYLMDKGHRVQQARGLIALGLFKDYDDIRNSPRQDFGTVMPGDIKYKDVNGDGVINSDDRVAIGATTKPNMIFGLGASANWKGLDFSFRFQGSGKSTYFIDGYNVYMFSSTVGWGNIFKDFADSNRWISADISGDPSTEDPNADYPRLSYGGNSNNYQNSTYWLRNGAYVRLKEVNIGYSLPKHIVNKIHLNNVRIFLIGTNLLTWSSFKLWDPEMGSSNGIKYPNNKTFTLGLTVNL